MIAYVQIAETRHPTFVPSTRTLRREYHPEIFALLTVDGIPSLEGLPTNNIFTVKSLVEIVIAVDGSYEDQMWQFRPGAASGDGQVAPLDYDPVDNNYHWEQV